jgi:hypothetical protein
MVCLITPSVTLDCIGSNHRMIPNNELDGLWKEAVVAKFWSTAPEFAWRAWGKPLNPCDDNRCPERDSNRAPLAYQSDESPLEPIFLCTNDINDTRFVGLVVSGLGEQALWVLPELLQVGIATGYGIDGRGSIPERGKISPPQRPDPFLDPLGLLSNGYQGEYPGG